VRELDHRGWPIVRLASEQLQVDVVPGQGGDILQVRWLPLGLDLLWSTPWGLREPGSAPAAADSYESFMHSYPGGWQTIFPNGGRATRVGDVEQSFHGEACRVAWGYEQIADGIELRTSLALSPFELRKRITVDGARLIVEETAHNIGDQRFDAMWSHHPAFGAPFLDGACVLDTAARTFLTDAEHGSDLIGGCRSAWPNAEGFAGAIDLRHVPGEGSGVTRLGYLTDFDRGFASIRSPTTGLRADLEWGTEVFPHAWLWIEANATDGFPVNRSWYVMAVEPASSYPGQGIDAAREAGTLLSFAPGQSRTATVSLTLQPL
jgi:hypothetical protein